MKILIVVPKPGTNLKSALVSKELELRGRGTTFYQERRGKWKHTTYPGWINLSQASKDMLIAKVQTKKEGEEWKLLSAFIGYIDRHFADAVDSISIYYR